MPINIVNTLLHATIQKQFTLCTLLTAYTVCNCFFLCTHYFVLGKILREYEKQYRPSSVTTNGDTHNGKTFVRLADIGMREEEDEDDNESSIVLENTNLLQETII
jgi:hypothetical protein